MLDEVKQMKKINYIELNEMHKESDKVLLARESGHLEGY